MPSANYTYEPGTAVYVLIPGSCAGTYSVRPATINRVEIKVNQASPSPTSTVNYVVTMTDDTSVRTIPESDVFPDKTTAASEAVLRYQSLFV